MSKYAQKQLVRQAESEVDIKAIKLQAKISVYTKIVQDLSYELKRLQKTQVN
jgi:hypothetical protein